MNTIILPANTNWTPEVDRFAFLSDGTETTISNVFINIVTKIASTTDAFNTVINCIPGLTFRFDKEVTLFF